VQENGALKKYSRRKIYSENFERFSYPVEQKKEKKKKIEQKIGPLKHSTKSFKIQKFRGKKCFGNTVLLFDRVTG
jgi:hypothetical protein